MRGDCVQPYLLFDESSELCDESQCPLGIHCKLALPALSFELLQAVHHAVLTLSTECSPNLNKAVGTEPKTSLKTSAHDSIASA